MRGKVLITGASGQLGRAVARYLARGGLRVVATDRRPGDPQDPPVVLHELAEARGLPELLDGVETVVHCGAVPSDNGHTTREILDSNVAGTSNLVQASLAAGVKKFLYASSIQVMASEGTSPHEAPEVAYLPLDGDCPPNPRNLYAFSKATGEVLVRSVLGAADVQCRSLRFPWLVEARSSGPWGRRLRPFSASEPRVLIEQGFTCLSFTDAARLVMACIESDLPGYGTYLPAFSVVPTPEVERYVRRYYAHVPMRIPAGEMKSLVDLSVVQAETGWMPQDHPPASRILEGALGVQRWLGRPD